MHVNTSAFLQLVASGLNNFTGSKFYVHFFFQLPRGVRTSEIHL